MLQTRFQEALLGMGGGDGNQWYNPFGFEPQNDPALIDWLTVDAKSRNTSNDRTAEVLVSRLFGKLPGGSMGLAIGAQYREQELDQWADENLRSGDLVGLPSEEPVSADRSLFSAYVELSLPIHYTLEAQIALRYEDYSDFGDTTNPKIALRWQPASWIMLRASWTTSFLAPDFWQLYAPDTPSLYGLKILPAANTLDCPRIVLAAPILESTAAIQTSGPKMGNRGLPGWSGNRASCQALNSSWISGNLITRSASSGSRPRSY